jgi:phosphate transport system protein
MRETFRQELRDLKMEVLLIGRTINVMTKDAASALVAGDLDLVEKVFTIEDEIDRRCLGVEERSLEIIATQFPVARDLRLIYSLSYIAIDRKSVV